MPYPIDLVEAIKTLTQFQTLGQVANAISGAAGAAASSAADVAQGAVGSGPMEEALMGGLMGADPGLGGGQDPYGEDIYAQDESPLPEQLIPPGGMAQGPMPPVPMAAGPMMGGPMMAAMPPSQPLPMGSYPEMPVGGLSGPGGEVPPGELERMAMIRSMIPRGLA